MASDLDQYISFPRPFSGILHMKMISKNKCELDLSEYERFCIL